MLYTNLKHLNTSQEYLAALNKDENVMVCCGRMDDVSILVYRIMEGLEMHYRNVKFYDIEFDNPESHVIRNFIKSTDVENIPILSYYKKGKLIATCGGHQTKEQIVSVIEKEFN
jgi:thioredoxin 1